MYISLNRFPKSLILHLPNVADPWQAARHGPVSILMCWEKPHGAVRAPADEAGKWLAPSSAHVWRIWPRDVSSDSDLSHASQSPSLCDAISHHCYLIPTYNSTVGYSSFWLSKSTPLKLWFFVSNQYSLQKYFSNALFHLLFRTDLSYIFSF